MFFCSYVGRPTAAASATGNKYQHKTELETFLKDAMDLEQLAMRVPVWLSTTAVHHREGRDSGRALTEFVTVANEQQMNVDTQERLTQNLTRQVLLSGNKSAALSVPVINEHFKDDTQESFASTDFATEQKTVKQQILDVHKCKQGTETTSTRDSVHDHGILVPDVPAPEGLSQSKKILSVGIYVCCLGCTKGFH